MNFNKAAQVLKNIRPSERSNSEPSHDSPNKSPSPKNGPVKVKQLFTQDQRKQTEKLGNQNDSRTTDERNGGNPRLMTNTWAPQNKNLEDQFKKFTMMNQYKQMGLNNISPDMQNLLSKTLASYNPGGRNYMKESKRYSKRNSRNRGQSANSKMSGSRKRKSPSRGRNEANKIFFKLLDGSMRNTKSRHKKNYSAHNETFKGNRSKRSSCKRSRASNTPKRGVRYANMFTRKGGSTKASRKNSAANSNERGAYSTYISHRVSPKGKRKKASMDYDLNNTNSFSHMLMNDMRMNYNNVHTRYGTRSRQGVIGSKKSSLIDSVLGNSTKAKERAAKMYAGATVHTPTPNNNTGFLNDSKLGREFLMMNGNNNHQHPYKMTSTGRGKTPHQKPGSPKRRKHSGGKRSHSRPRSSKHSGQPRPTNFQAKFFDPKQLLSGYNMA